MRVVLTSVALCVLLGVPVGASVAGILGGVPLLPFGMDIAGVPVLAYAFITGGPAAFLAGAVAGLILVALLNWKHWHPPWQGWMAAGAPAGAIVSSVSVGSLLSAAPDAADVLPLLALAATTGAVCGGVLGFYGWLEQRSRRRHS